MHLYEAYKQYKIPDIVKVIKSCKIRLLGQLYVTWWVILFTFHLAVLKTCAVLHQDLLHLELGGKIVYHNLPECFPNILL